jgi:predicted hydrocarbon binding protein
MDRDMKRIEFFQVLAAGAATPVALAGQEAPSPGERFKQEWVSALMATLDSQLDEAGRRALMESCGRACARRGAVAAMGQAAQGDVDKLVAAIGEHVGKENVRREGNVVHLRYAKCFCPLVSAGPERLSKTYCNCSRGWAMEVFESVTGKKAAVELVSSIKRGDADCRFVIRLG